MKASRALAWLLFVAWCGWLVAAQAWLGRADVLGRARPDLGLVFALALAARAEPGAIPVLGFRRGVRARVGVFRAAAVLLAGLFGALLASLALRGIVEVQSARWRWFVGGTLALAFEAWIALSRTARASGASFDPSDALRAWPAALATALAAWILAPLFAHLPGLSPLRTRAW